MRIGIVVILAPVLLGFQITVCAEVRDNRIGINVGSPAVDYSPDKIFADAMRSHRSWERIDGTTPGVEPPLDANFWPTTDARCLVWHGLNTGNNNGTYRLSFTGTADVSPFLAVASIANKKYDAATNKTTADLVITDKENPVLFLNFTNTSGGVKNIKLMRPLTPGSAQSYPDDRVFTDQYLNDLTPFKCIRYVDWGVIQASGDSLWSDRTKWSDARQAPPIPAGKDYPTGRGPAWESVIMMANTSGKDAWICLPHMATDDYIRNLAKLFRDGNEYTKPLRPDLNLYIEYSNEIWNFGFPFAVQTTWARLQALAVGYPLNFDGEPDNGGFARYKAMRTVQISMIFREVFGDAQMMTRIRPVLCWQKGWIDVINKTISFIDRFYNKRDSRSNWKDPHPVNYYIYGGSSSGYWYTDSGKGLTADNIWTNGTWDASKFYDACANELAWAKAYGLVYMAYEGDNHPAYNGDETIVKQIHWDPRMKESTLEHLKVWNRLDGDLFNFLVLHNYGLTDWGVLNVVEPQKSPQWQAIQEFNAAKPVAVDIGTTVPFSRPGGSFDTWSYEARQANGTGAIKLASDGLGYATSYLFNSARDTSCKILVQYRAEGSAELDVEYDGNKIGTFKQTVLSTTPGMAIECKGNKAHSIRLVARNGAVNIVSIEVQGNGPYTTNVFANTNRQVSPQLQISPNRAASVLTVSLSTPDRWDCFIVDTKGKLVEKKSEVRGSQHFDVAKYPKGIYLVTARTATTTMVQKFVK